MSNEYFCLCFRSEIMADTVVSKTDAKTLSTTEETVINGNVVTTVTKTKMV